MSGVDEEAERLLADCPILSDDKFLREHPGVVNVAGFLSSAARVSYRMQKGYVPFDRLGVNSIRGFLEKLQQGDSQAVQTYERVRDICCFG